MKKILFFVLAGITTIYSCDNANTDNGTRDADATADTSKKIMTTPPPDQIPLDTAVDWIKRFDTLTPPYKLQMVKFSTEKMGSVFNGGTDTIRLWMAAKPSLEITVVVQTKKRGPNKDFKYYDLNTIEAKMATTSTSESICPQPPNCVELIEQ